MSDQEKLNQIMREIKDLREVLEVKLKNDVPNYDPSSMAIRIGILLGWIETATTRLASFETRLGFIAEDLE